MQIWAEKKAMKKHSPLFANDKKRKREETLQDVFSDSEEDGGVVPQKIHHELKKAAGSKTRPGPLHTKGRNHETSAQREHDKASVAH